MKISTMQNYTKIAFMWDVKTIFRLDLRLVLSMLGLMVVSVLVIASVTKEPESDCFFTSTVIHQLQWFFLGSICFLFFAGIDYRKILQWAWLYYFLAIILLTGLFFTHPIHTVHRWYRLPFLPMDIQPSEFTKISLVFFLAWFLEKKTKEDASFFVLVQIGLVVGLPFFLILKQPDLGTALVLFPIALMMSYFAGVHSFFLRIVYIGIAVVSIIFLSIFTGVVPYEKMKPYCCRFLKSYQYERLNPKSYHQQAALACIASGGYTGSGWNKSEFASQHWLPAAHTDSVIAVFSEEFGFLGFLVVLFLFYNLLRVVITVAATARETSAKLLSVGIAVYLIMHILGNIAMMCGLLPISGVPLLMVSYGGSSIVMTMSALGVLQSIYRRRCMF